MKKIINPKVDNNTIIKFKYIKNNNHVCDKDINLTTKENIQTKKENIKFLIDIIKENPLIKISEIKLKLIEKQIVLSVNIIRYFLNKIRNNNYINDENYIKIIHYDKISYKKNNIII